MVYPWLKLGAKLVHEADSVDCTKPGRYWIVLCNKGSWVYRKTINLIIQLVDKTTERTIRCHIDGTFSECSKPIINDYMLLH